MAKKQPAPAPVEKADRPAGSPIVDSNLAANAAARAILNRNKVQEATGGGSTESASFKKLKASLAKPQASLLDDALHKIAPSDPKRPTLPHLGGKQVAHNQTFGDVMRTGVPRRTPG